MAAREMGGLSLADALSLCELLAKADPGPLRAVGRRHYTKDDTPAK
jgi:hypothetical protein